MGPSRRKALLRRFGSLKRLRDASLEELLEVPSMSRPVAERILESFQGAGVREEGCWGVSLYSRIVIPAKAGIQVEWGGEITAAGPTPGFRLSPE